MQITEQLIPTSTRLDIAKIQEKFNMEGRALTLCVCPDENTGIRERKMIVPKHPLLTFDYGASFARSLADLGVNDDVGDHLLRDLSKSIDYLTSPSTSFARARQGSVSPFIVQILKIGEHLRKLDVNMLLAIPPDINIVPMQPIKSTINWLMSKEMNDTNTPFVFRLIEPPSPKDFVSFSILGTNDMHARFRVSLASGEKYHTQVYDCKI